MARQPNRRPRAAATPRSASAARRSPLPFDALLVEGALIAPAQLARIAAGDAGSQAPADYALRTGLTPRDEIPSAYKIGQTLFAQLSASSTPSLAATITFTEALLREAFGFTDLRPHPDATLAAGAGQVPIVVVPPASGLDRPDPTLTQATGRRMSAALRLQDHLNADDAALWGLACNGETLRLLRDNPSLTRPAYIEADLRRIFEANSLADFSALWMLVHATRFAAPPATPSACILERWRDAGQKAGEAARERLRTGVEAALAQLGDGLLRHPANARLRERLHSHELSLPEFFNQLLRLVYRLIFLLAAEDRGLLHPPGAPAAARTLYATGYSLARLRDRAVRPAPGDRHDDLWDGLLITFAALTRGEPRLGLPALDGLFAVGETPDLDTAALSNAALLKAMRGLAWLDGAGAPVPVNWRDMEAEELGSVYESLLELTPRLADDGRGFAFADDADRGNQRKTTGSYYTPDSLVQALLASALDPVLDRVQAEAPDASVERSLGKEEVAQAAPHHVKAVLSYESLRDSNPDDSLERAVSAGQDPAAALLGVRVLDPACGSGHFLLAAGRHIAARVARLRAGGTPGAEEYRHALRDVARTCLYGVDRNPMAVELAKVALWIETVEPGKPLGFLGANLRCGDALLGVWDLDTLRHGIPDAAYKPLTGDDRVACRALLVRNRAEREGQGELNLGATGGHLPPAAPLARAALAWRALPEDSPAEIAQKRARFEAARATPGAYALQAACDLYVAAFLSPKPPGADATPRTSLVPTTAAVWARATGGQVYGPLEGRAVDLARTARAFHWELEFPDIWAAGGFNAVLGNPPWDRIKPQEKEFFAVRAPDVAEAPNAAERRTLIAALARAETGTRDRVLFDEWEIAKRVSEAATTFARVPGEEGGRFPLTGRGDLNTYALFAELFTRAASERGQAGAVIPTGIATDATTAPFFASLVCKQQIISMFDFENSAPIFPGVHRSFKFSLLTTGRDVAEPRFVFYLRDVTQLANPARHFTLSRDDLNRLSPNSGNVSLFRSNADAGLTKAIYDRVPILVRGRTPACNPWGIELARMFHMADDSSLFRTAAQLAASGLVRQGTDWADTPGIAPPQAALALAGGRDRGTLPLDGGGRPERRYVPLYEAKMVHHYDHRWATYDGTESRDVTAEEHTDPTWEPTPRYWVLEPEVQVALPPGHRDRLWLMGWRDICRATDERTLIACAMPRGAVGHTLPLLFTTAPAHLSAALLGNLGALVLDYIVRQKVGGIHITYGLLEQLPCLSPSAYTQAALSFIVPRVLELTYTSNSLAAFARDLGHAGPPFAWDESRRATLRAELDAWYARAYGLTRDELRYVLDPADTNGPDYPSETFRVLRDNEKNRYKEYRTRRLVLDAWDQLDDSTR